MPRQRKSRAGKIPLSPLMVDLSSDPHRRRSDNSQEENSGPLVLERNKLKEKLEKLKSKANVSKDALDEEHAALFKEVVGAMKMLYGTSLYPDVMADIASVFSTLPTENMEPGTVHSFFVGCTSTDNFSGKPGCNPKCASGLPDPNVTVCEDTFLSLKQDKFIAHNTKKTSHAYIFLEDPGFVGFTVGHIEQLRVSGVTKASLIRAKKDIPSQFDTTQAVELEKLPVRKSNPSPPESTTPTWIIWLIIIVVFLLFLAGAGWYTLNK